MNENRLIHEKSPYLLQHAGNPVDWYPWGKAAFEKARQADKPVFLWVGYATCHWCHVMERESFEDETAARNLNETFVCIKVDREERPDIDAVYMTACRMMTGGGGWPLTIFMTPDKQPFFAGTYIPKRNRFGRPGLIELCAQVRQLWAGQRKKLLETAGTVSGHLSGAFRYQGAGEIGTDMLEIAHTQIRESFDGQRGGFGPPPKFPTPHKLLFLLRYHYNTGQEEALGMVEKTLAAMRMGGMWDHVGFGFHRYATDAQWLLPHFEKMLYDQALLAMAYLEAHQITRNPDHARTAEEIFTYVLRDMTDFDGPFYAAEDADSEGEEGKFHVWTLEAFQTVLGPETADRWAAILNLTPEGNFTDEATGKRTGANIPHLSTPLDQWAEELGRDPASLQAEWEEIRQALFRHRENRIHPLKDDKILTDWNGLMIAALAMGARILGRPEWGEAARKAARFLLVRLRDADGGLLHRFRDGTAGIRGHADDYAFLIRGLMELYRTTFDPEFALEASRLQDRMIEDFWDSENGGFFLTEKGSTELPVRPKEIYDGAAPSANSVALLNLLQMGRLTGEPRWEQRASALSRTFADNVRRHPSAFTYFLLGVDFSLAPHREVVIASGADPETARSMASALDAEFAPHRTVLFKSPENADKLVEVAPFTAGLGPVDGRAAAYVCKDFACGRPAATKDQMVAILKTP